MHTEPISPPESPAATIAIPSGGFVLTNPEPQPHEPAHVGELLSEGREHAGMSIGDVANRLRMSVKQIEAIERADYAVLPAGTFLRGFVRNYAKAVGLNVEDVLTLLERTHPSGVALKATGVVAPMIAAEPVAFQSRSDALATPKARAIFAALLVACLMAVVWYWWEFVRPHRADGGRPREAQTVVVQPTVVAPLPVPAAGAEPAAESSPPLAAPAAATLPSVPAAVAPAAALSGNTPAGSTPPASSPATNVTAQPKPAPSLVVAKAAETGTPEKLPAVGEPSSRAKKAGDTGVIGFTFSGESWVEVVDGSGRTVMSRRYKAGDVDEVSGRGPFSIVVGNAQSTRMAYNGREFDLAPHTKSTVARVNVK